MKKFLGILAVIATALFVFGAVSKKAEADNSARQKQNTDQTYNFTSPGDPGVQTDGKDKQQGDVIFGRSYQNDTSIPLRDMEPEPYLGKKTDREANENPKIPHAAHIDRPDEAVQDKNASLISLLAPRSRARC